MRRIWKSKQAHLEQLVWAAEHSTNPDQKKYFIEKAKMLLKEIELDKILKHSRKG